MEELIDEILNRISDNNIKIVLEAIKKGLTWEDDNLVKMFTETPNSLGTRARAWLPRKIQEKIGKIERISVVALPTMGKIPRYKKVEDYIFDGGSLENVSVIQAYEIRCACGKVFIGREPEHQIHCRACKRKKKTEKNREEYSELDDQVDMIFLMLSKRQGLSDHMKNKIAMEIKRRMLPNMSHTKLINIMMRHGYYEY